MKAIIFGANGQDGYYLSQLLLKKNISIIGISRTGLNLSKGDVSNRKFVDELIKQEKPEYIFHLAANSSTKHQHIFENHETISTGTINILESVFNHSPKTKVFLSGSAVQFENKGIPINEETPFAAISPYAVSRIHSVYAGRYYRNLGIKVYIGYFFNHDSPLRTTRHVNQQIVAGVKMIAKGNSEKIELGNIDVRKEFNFAGDIMEAVWLLVNQEIHFELVLGSGKAYSIKEWLEYCFLTINKNWENYILINENYKPEYQILVSDPKKIISLGWKP